MKIQRNCAADSMEKHTLDLAGTGIGIQNVVTRLRMYYGEELSVVLESEPEKGDKNLLSGFQYQRIRRKI